MVMIEAPQRRRITRAEYDRMIDMGFFEGEKLELLRGELVKVSPVGHRHVWVVTRLNRLLCRVCDQLPAQRLEAQCQQPLFAADESEPEPDLALVEAFPQTTKASVAHLVIEVSESSLRQDLLGKAVLYAESAVTEYWVVDLVEDVVHVHRDREDGRWRRVTVHAIDETLRLVAFPDVAIELAAIIPAR